MTYVKICGITNFEDALFAAQAGADMLGFNFYRASSRYIDPLAARAIIEELSAPDLLMVGVFVNEASPDVVRRLANESGVGALQLHGDESPEYCSALNHQQVIKVLRVSQEFVPERALNYEVEGIMLDAFDKKLRGGTGHVIDWSIARRTRELTPKLFLAGGLSPENVGAAVVQVQPYAVDSCSALETSPGRKDPERVAAFVRAAKAAGVKP